MFNRIIEFSINNKFIIVLPPIVPTIGGIYSMTRVPILNNQVHVITQSPNLGTADIEQFVTFPE